MSHECPLCGQWCDCDGEDHGQPAPDDCRCDCWKEEERDEFDDGPLDEHFYGPIPTPPQESKP